MEGTGPQAHLVKTFKLSNDPAFEDRLIDVVGLYLSPPENAIVLCFDEKSQIQALNRTQPSLPMTRGRAGTMTHDYKRHGTTTLFATLNVATGEMIGKCFSRHRHEEFLAFLRIVDKEVGKGTETHMILDNYSAHKHPGVRAWLERHQRFNLHFIPTSSSWLNLVERWFRDITTKRIRRGSFTSVPQLVDGLRTSATNQGSAVDFTWNQATNQILSDGLHDFIYSPMDVAPVLQVVLTGGTPVVDLLCQDGDEDIRGVVQLSGGTTTYDGSLVNYTDYDAFGSPITESSGAANPGGLMTESGGYLYSTTPIGFASMYEDETGLDYAVHRVYDASVGQFISIDPFVAETQQPYSYSDQNPVNLSDPDGLWVIGYEGEGFPTSPLMTPDQCKNFLNTLSVVAKGGPTTVSAYEALEFFSCANLENDQAQNLVNAFNMSNGATISFVAYEQIYRQDTGNLEEGVYVRYFGSGNHFYGSFAGDIYIHTNKPIVAAAAYNLIGRAESARYVETVEGFNCEDYLGGGARTLQSTYLIGGVAGGQSGVTQYDAFNADDWIYGTPKPTSEGSMPQPLGSGSSGSTNRCHGHHPS